MQSSPATDQPGSKAGPALAGDFLRLDWPLLLLGIASLYLLAVVIGLTPIRIMHGYATTIIEPQPVAGAIRVATGEPLYQDFTKSVSMTPITYGALTYLLPGTVARLSGRADALTILYLGRSVSLLAALLLPFLLVASCGQRQVPWQWAWVSLLPLVWFPRLAENWSKFLPHHAALTCSILGWVLLNGCRGHSRRRQLVFGAAAVLAWTSGFLFHPTVLIGPVAWLVEMCIASPERRGRQWFASVRKGLVPLVAYAALSLTTAWIIDRQTGGLWYRNTVEAMKICRYDLSYTWVGLGHLEAPGLLLLGAMTVTALLLWKLSPLFPAFLAVLALELILMTKQGSSSSYLAGSTTLWGVAFATAAFPARSARMGRGLPAEPVNRLLGPLTLVMAVGAFWTIPAASTRHWEIPVPDYREVDRITRAIRDLSPRSPLFLDAFYAQRHDYRYPYADPYHASLLAAGGVVKFEGVENALRSRDHDLVIANVLYLGGAHYHDAAAVPDGIRTALLENYTLAAAGHWLVIGRPKDAVQLRPGTQASPR